MLLRLQRVTSGPESTLGLLFEDDRFTCFTLEDQAQDVKVAGETRIPAGEYELTLRTVGGHHRRYSRRFPDIHKGMIWIRDVPGFEYVLIHIGNTDDDSAGCVLVGRSAKVTAGGDAELLWSKLAYLDIYPRIAKAIEDGGARLRILDPPGT